MSAFSEHRHFFWIVYIHEGMPCGLVCQKVLTCGLVCRKVLRNSLFEFQGESQGRTKAQDTPHTFCIAMLDCQAIKVATKDVYTKLDVKVENTVNL